MSRLSPEIFNFIGHILARMKDAHDGQLGIGVPVDSAMKPSADFAIERRQAESFTADARVLGGKFYLVSQVFDIALGVLVLTRELASSTVDGRKSRRLCGLDSSVVPRQRAEHYP